MNEEVYQQILNEIKRKRALIVLIVDLLDIPNSISRSWTKFLQDKSSSNLIFVLGNKVDLLPKGKTKIVVKRNDEEFIVSDNDDYLSNVRQCLMNECEIKEMSSDARASISLMTTSHFPINVIQTRDVDDFYQKSLEKNQLGVK